MQRGTTHRNDCSPHVIPLLSLAESMEGWTHSFSSPFMLHGRRLASRSVVLASTREAVECDWVLSSSLIIDEQCLSFKTSQPLHLKRDFSKETSQKRLLKRDFSKEEREERKEREQHSTHSPLLAMSLTSLVIGPWSMGRGRKRREKGKEGEEGRRGGEKGTLRPTGLYYFPVGAKGAHARPSTSSRFGAGLSCWKPRRSRGFPHDLTGSHKSQFQTPTQNERARGPLSTLQTAGL